MAAAQEGQAADLVSALLAFQAKPGQYALNLRQPELLHAHVKQVLMICLDKPVPGVFIAENLARQVKQAAAFFLKAALLREGADHYTLLGVPPNVSAGVLRDHYRLWMRLTHPDQADAGLSWPQDTASRINLAHDVLSDAMLRAKYDESLVRIASADAMPVRARDFRAREYSTRRAYPLQRRSRKRTVVLGGMFTVSVLVVAFLFWDAAPPSTMTASIAPPVATTPPAAVVASIPDPVEKPVESNSEPIARFVPRPPAVAPTVAVASAPAPSQSLHARPQDAAKETEPVRQASVTPVATPVSVKSGQPAFEEVRPALDQLHQAMSNGDWRQLEAAIEPSMRRTGGAQALLRAYRYFSADAKSVRVTGARVQFLESTSAHVSVEVQTRMEVASQESIVVELNWRAVFLRDGPKLSLVRLHSGGE